jgi:hypothetical protein
MLSIFHPPTNEITLYTLEKKNNPGLQSNVSSEILGKKIKLTAPFGTQTDGLVASYDTVAKSVWIKEKLSSIYGSNRSLELGIYSVIPMLLELKQLKRTKRSIYKAEPNYKILHPVIQEIYLYTDIYLSGSKSILKNDTLHRPWYVFNNLPTELTFRTSLLKSDDDYIFLSC